MNNEFDFYVLILRWQVSTIICSTDFSKFNMTTRVGQSHQLAANDRAIENISYNKKRIPIRSISHSVFVFQQQCVESPSASSLAQKLLAPKHQTPYTNVLFPLLFWFLYRNYKKNRSPVVNEHRTSLRRLLDIHNVQRTSFWHP